MPSISAYEYSFVRICFKDSTFEEQNDIEEIIDSLVNMVNCILVEEGLVTENDVRMLANEILGEHVFEPKINGDNVGLNMWS